MVYKHRQLKWLQNNTCSTTEYHWDKNTCMKNWIMSAHDIFVNKKGLRRKPKCCLLKQNFRVKNKCSYLYVFKHFNPHNYIPKKLTILYNYHRLV